MGKVFKKTLFAIKTSGQGFKKDPIRYQCYLSKKDPIRYQCYLSKDSIDSE